MEFFSKYIITFPTDSHIYAHTAYVLEKLSDIYIEKYDDICRLCEKAVIWREKSVPWRLWALALYKREKLQDAYQKCLHALELIPGNIDVLTLLAKILLKANHDSVAVSILNYISELHPSSQEASKILYKTQRGAKETSSTDIKLIDIEINQIPEKYMKSSLYLAKQNRRRSCEELCEIF